MTNSNELRVGGRISALSYEAVVAGYIHDISDRNNDRSREQQPVVVLTEERDSDEALCRAA